MRLGYRITYGMDSALSLDVKVVDRTLPDVVANKLHVDFVYAGVAKHR